jgi:hypothetical protein
MMGLKATKEAGTSRHRDWCEGTKGFLGFRRWIEVDSLSSTRSAEFILEVCTCKVRFRRDDRG